jgi:hypothetical protein
MVINENLLTLGKKARGLNGKPVFFTKSVEEIIIHWIGPYPGQSVFAPWYWWEDGSDNTGVQASAHFVVKDFDVLQALPLNEVGWHSSDMRSYYSIGIEVIPMNVNGEFSEATIKTLKDLVTYVRQTYPNAKLSRHFDGTQKKNCPSWYTPFVDDGEQRWQELKSFLDGAI